MTAGMSSLNSMTITRCLPAVKAATQPLWQDLVAMEDKMEEKGPNSPPAGSEQEKPRISIELTEGQLDKLIREAAGVGNMSVLLSGLQNISETVAREPTLLDDPRMSRSLLTGLLMLAALPSDGTGIGVLNLSRSLNMSPSTTHRYLSTLVGVGLAEREPTTRRYKLVQ
jgi:hypothetical protein